MCTDGGAKKKQRLESEVVERRAYVKNDKNLAKER